MPWPRQTKTVIATPTVSNGVAYSAGDLIGGKMTLLEATRENRSGRINTVVISDKGKQNAIIDVIFFKSDPSATTFTDNGAFTLADADLLKVIGTVKIVAADYSSLTDNSVVCKANLGLQFSLDGAETLYAAMLAGGTPTYTSTSDLQVAVAIDQD